MKKTLALIAIFGAGFYIGTLFFQKRSANSGSPDEVSRFLELMSKPADAVAQPSQFEELIVNAAAKIEPAVVNIDTVSTVRDMWGRMGSIEGKGSGVIISPDGYIVTNSHVISSRSGGVADKITVNLADGRTFEANHIGSDPQNDIALLKIDGKSLPAAQMGDSDKLRVGEWSVAIGNPYGFENTVTSGIVSALNRRVPAGENAAFGMIQTDAAINEGNSGGALANSRGQLIGINTMIFTPVRGSVGLGFAIPVNRVKKITAELIKTGKVTYAWSGLSQLIDVNEVPPSRLRYWFGDTDVPKKGSIVMRLWQGSPAASAGVQAGDIVLEIDGRALKDKYDVIETIRNAKPGQSVKFKIWREGNTQTVTVRLEETPTETPRRTQ